VKETLDDAFQSEDLQRVPVLFLLNKNDLKDFKGVDFIADRLELNSVPCSEHIILPVAAIDQIGLDGALSWIQSAVVENQKASNV